MKDLHIGVWLYGHTLEQTPTRYVNKVDDGGGIAASETFAFTGVGIRYANYGATGGTFTSVTHTYAGQHAFTLEGFSIPVSSFEHWWDTLDTNAALTTIFGGADSMIGSASSDQLNGYDGDDHIASGGGFDSIVAGAGADTVFGQEGDDVIEGGVGTDYLRGDDGRDVINGGADFDDINGNMGNDLLHGNGGNDWVVGGKDNDTLYGDEGDDVVLGNLGNDTCSGNIGNDVVRGGQGDDSVTGFSGNDWISGDRGSDTLSGGLGADIFHTFAEAGIDIVTDFSALFRDRVNLLPGSQYTVAQVGADTVISVAGGATMTLKDVQLSSLVYDWIFVG